jgi:LAGLIDADG DNA endonuclease family
LFKDYCGTPLQVSNHKPSKITGKEYSFIRFNTLAFPCFNEFYALFSPNGIKVIPLNIGELLTPIGLAYWILDDGSSKNLYWYYLCTSQQVT